jgi:hypothetical protein
MNDLRHPDVDETPLSESEVLQGLRDGSISDGYHARARAFAEVLVLERRRVEFVNFKEFA